MRTAVDLGRAAVRMILCDKHFRSNKPTVDLIGNQRARDAQYRLCQEHEVRIGDDHELERHGPLSAARNVRWSIERPAEPGAQQHAEHQRGRVRTR